MKRIMDLGSRYIDWLGDIPLPFQLFLTIWTLLVPMLVVLLLPLIPLRYLLTWIFG